MQQEIEVKFLEVDHDAIRSKLTQLGAELEHPLRLMKRAVFDFQDQRFKQHGKRLRVRDEGDKVTVTFKSSINDDGYADEIETTVGSYQTMVDLLEAIGPRMHSYQESKRETWLYKDSEIVLDEWPWLRPYIEIEGPTEEVIKAIAADLELNWEDSLTGSVDVAYRYQYPKMADDEGIGAVERVVFGASLPQYLRDRQ